MVKRQEPHCWTRFRKHEVVGSVEHPDLMGKIGDVIVKFWCPRCEREILRGNTDDTGPN